MPSVLRRSAFWRKNEFRNLAAGPGLEPGSSDSESDETTIAPPRNSTDKLNPFYNINRRFSTVEGGCYIDSRQEYVIVLIRR